MVVLYLHIYNAVNPGIISFTIINFYRTVTHRPKISIFAPQGLLVAPIHVKFGTAKGHVGLLGRAKFHANRCPSGNEASNMAKVPLFGKESSSTGEPFDQFLQLLGAFIRPTLLQ